MASVKAVISAATSYSYLNEQGLKGVDLFGRLGPIRVWAVTGKDTAIKWVAEQDGFHGSFAGHTDPVELSAAQAWAAAQL